MRSSVVVLVLSLSVLASDGAAAEPGSDAAVIARLATERRDAARRTYEALWADYREARASEDALYRWSVRWLEAEMQVSDQPAERAAALRGHFERMRDLERLIRRLRGSGQLTIDQVGAAEYYRAEAEIWLLQGKEEAKHP